MIVWLFVSLDVFCPYIDLDPIFSKSLHPGGPHGMRGVTMSQPGSSSFWGGRFKNGRLLFKQQRTNHEQIETWFLAQKTLYYITYKRSTICTQDKMKIIAPTALYISRFPIPSRLLPLPSNWWPLHRTTTLSSCSLAMAGSASVWSVAVSLWLHLT